MRNKSKSRKDSRVAGARSYPDVRLVPAKRKGKCLVPLFRTKSFFLLLSDGIELEKKEKKVTICEGNKEKVNIKE